MAQAKQSKSLGATLGALVLAGLAWLAQSMGWINLDGGSSQASGGTDPGPTSQQSSKPETSGGTLTAEWDQSGSTATATDSGDLVFGIPRSTFELGLEKIHDAFDNGLSDVLVECAGRVVHLLPDDNHGSRHQLFLLEPEGRDGITLKLSHNIDQAPYIPLEKGDTVSFFGEYEWTEKGGVVHWTHRAHGGDHPDGWIRHKGKLYW